MAEENIIESEALAPLTHMDSEMSRSRWYYVVYFKEGHSLEDHLDFVADKSGQSTQEYWEIAWDILRIERDFKVAYRSRFLDEGPLLIVRSDPGVEKVVKFGSVLPGSHMEAAMNQIRHPRKVTYPGPTLIHIPWNWQVHYGKDNSDFDIAEHFRLVGRSFEYRSFPNHGTYQIHSPDITDEDLYAILSDPRVERVEQQRPAQFDV